MTNKISVFQKSYQRKYRLNDTKDKNLRNRISKLREEADMLEQKRQRLKFPSWLDHLVKPIAEELVRYYPDRRYEILGPFGICAHTTIWFKKRGVPEKEIWDKKDNIIGITFRPGDLDKGELSIVDESKTTGEYREGTLGEVNGMNHPTIPMPKTIKELKRWVR